MKTRNRILSTILATALPAIALTVTSAHAASMSAGLAAPAVSGEDGRRALAAALRVLESMARHRERLQQRRC